MYCDYPEFCGGGGGGSGPAAMAAEVHYNTAADDISSDGDRQTQVYQTDYFGAPHAWALEEPTEGFDSEEGSNQDFSRRIASFIAGLQTGEPMAVGQDAGDSAVDLEPSNPTYEPGSPTHTATEVEASMALPPPGLHAVPEPLTALPPPGLQAVPGPSSQATSTGDGSASTGAAGSSVETLLALPPPGLQAVPEQAGGIDIVAVEAGIAAAIYGAGPEVKGVGEAGGSDCYLSSMAESDSRGDGQQADALTTATLRDVPMELSLAGDKVVAAPLPAQPFAGTVLNVMAPEFALVATTAIEEVQPPPMWTAPPAKHVPMHLVAAVIHPKAQSSAAADDEASAPADDEADISLTATGQDIFEPPRVPADRGRYKPPPAALDAAMLRPCNLILSQPKAKHQRVDPNPPPRVDAKPAASWFALPAPTPLQDTPPIAPPQARPPTAPPQATPPTARARTSRTPPPVPPWWRRNRGNTSPGSDDSPQENEGRARTKSC